MSVVIEDKQGKRQIITKGAVEEMLSICSHTEFNGEVQSLTDELKVKAQKISEEMNRKGMRVLAVAQKSYIEKVGNFSVSDEKEMVVEGKTIFKETKHKKRCTKLRNAVIQKFTKENGHISCSVCGFDFEEVYKELGKGYIEIHHEVPIYQYSDEGFGQYVEEAVKNMKPLCANCHRMIHRQKNPLSIEELKRIVGKNNE